MRTLLALALLLPGPAMAAPGPDFAFNLFREARKASGDKNVFISPLSVRAAVGMAFAGAAAGTREAMAGTLGVDPKTSTPDFLKAESAVLRRIAAADPKVKLRIANSLWLKRGFTFHKSYVGPVSAAFDAAVNVREFNRAALDELNGWVKEKTEGRIPKILDEFRPLDTAVLLNAIYFKGSWAKRFDAKLTAPRDFLAAGGRTVRHPFMNQDGKYDYYDEPGLQVLRLPYGGGRLSMSVLLPGRGSSLGALEKKLDAKRWAELRGKLGKRKGRVALPKFKLEYALGLNGPLSGMGMGVAFDPNKADFTSMAPAAEPADRLHISRVLHKAFVEVNEEGTEAAAATAVVMATKSISMDEEPPFVFVADRPFVYLIEEAQTGAVLFLGALNEPSHSPPPGGGE